MRTDEQLATIRRICAASGIRVESLDAVECVKLLAREHAARAAMVKVLTRQAAPAPTMFTSEPLPDRPSAFYAGDRYFANEEDAQRAQRDLDAAQREDVARLTAAARGRLRVVR